MLNILAVKVLALMFPCSVLYHPYTITIDLENTMAIYLSLVSLFISSTLTVSVLGGDFGRGE